MWNGKSKAWNARIWKEVRLSELVDGHMFIPYAIRPVLEPWFETLYACEGANDILDPFLRNITFVSEFLTRVIWSIEHGKCIIHNAAIDAVARPARFEQWKRSLAGARYQDALQSENNCGIH